MLEFLRKGVKSWVAKVLLLLLIASFAVWGIGDVFSTRLDSAVATVGDESVTVDEFANALQRQRVRLSQQAGQAVSYADMRQYGFDQRVLAGLIRDAAFREELNRLGIAAPDEAVAEAIRTNSAFQSGAGGFSEAAYRMALSRIGFTPAEFEQLTRTVLGQQILTDAASGTGEPVPGLAARLAAHSAETRAVTLVTLPPDRAEPPGEPAGEALMDYFSEHQDRYYEPERRWGHYLHVSIDRLAAEAEVTEEEIRAVYEDEREAYAAPATRTIDQLPLPADRADALAKAVKSGERSFEEVAEELGEDPADLSLGTVRRDDLPQSTAEAVFAATEPGVIGPVEAPVGPVLVRVRAVTEGGATPFEEVRGQIAERIAREKAISRAPDYANRIEELRAEGRTMPEIAEAIGLELRSFEGLARDGTLADGTMASGFKARSVLIEEVFAALDHEEREILPTEAGGYFVVLVERIEQRALPPLQEISEKVEADWARERRVQAVLEEARGLAGDVSAGRTLAAIAEEEGLSVTELGAFPRAAAPPSLPDDLVARLFEMDAGEAAAAVSSDGQRVLLASVTAIEMPEPDVLAEMTAQVQNRLAEMRASDTGELFSRAIIGRYETEIDRDRVDAVFNMIGGGQGGG